MAARRTVGPGAWSIAAVVLLLGLPGCLGPRQTPPPAETRDGRWRQDVEWLVGELPRRHVEPFAGQPREVFLEQAAALAEAVPERSDDELVVGLWRLVAGLGDGHTRVGWPVGERAFGILPILLGWFEEGLIVAGAGPGHEPLLGRRVVAIGGHPTAEVLADAAELIPIENESSRRDQVPPLLTVPEILHALGFADGPGGALFTLEDADGELESVRLERVSDDGEITWSWGRVGGPPRRRTDEGLPYWFEVLPESDAVLLSYNQCVEDERLPVAELVERLLDESTRLSLRHLVVDLRRNGGGSSRVLRPLLEALERHRDRLAPDRLVVLVGRGTYSSALMNAVQMKQQHGALLVGEPTGGRPNHHGEVRAFELPNSGLAVHYSTKTFRQVDGDPPSLVPDVVVPVRYADWSVAHDAALEAALRLVGRPTR
jgi:hypothetical protein